MGILTKDDDAPLRNVSMSPLNIMEQHLFKTIIVKCPAALNLNSQDFSLQIEVESTVGDLKSALSTQHPCKPHPEDQRLVFRGRLLTDTLTISEMSEKVSENLGDEYEDNLVIHMVLRSGVYSSCEKGKEKEKEKDKVESVTSSPVLNRIISNTLDTENRESSRSASPDNTIVIESEQKLIGVKTVDGTIIHVDLSKVVLFDGNNYYCQKGSLISMEQIRPMSPTTVNTVQQQQQQTDAHIIPRLRNRFRRLNFDFSALFVFLARFAVVIMVLVPSWQPVQIAILTIIFSMIFLLQAGVFSSLIRTAWINNIWNDVVRRNRAMPPIIEPQEPNPLASPQIIADAHINNEQPLLDQPMVALDGTLNVPDPANVQFIQRNPMAVLFEIISTFILSLLPTEPPIRAAAVQQPEVQPNPQLEM